MARSDDFPFDVVRVHQLEAALAAAVERRVPGPWRPLPNPRRLLGAPWALLTVPAKHPGFGDLELLLDGDRGYQVGVGRFTHRHFELVQEPDPAALARQVVDFAAGVLGDEVVCFQRWRGGGCRPREAPEGALARLLRRGPLWTWSGPVT